MKKGIWIKGSELRKMTNSQLAKYEFNARITNPDEPSDHELLKQLAKNQASDHELLKQLARNQASDHELLKQLAKNQASDHELLKQLAKNQASDHELLLMLVNKVTDIETKQDNDHKLLVKTNKLLLKVIELNNLKTE